MQKTDCIVKNRLEGDFRKESGGRPALSSYRGRGIKKSMIRRHGGLGRGDKRGRQPVYDLNLASYLRSGQEIDDLYQGIYEQGKRGENPSRYLPREEGKIT